jgi:hypothetical protein
MKKTELCRVAKYLVFCDFNKPLPEKIIKNYKQKPWFDRLILLAENKQKQIIKSIKLINFQTGTYRKSANEGSKTSKQSYIYKDETNHLYKW